MQFLSGNGAEIIPVNPICVTYPNRKEPGLAASIEVVCISEPQSEGSKSYQLTLTHTADLLLHLGRRKGEQP